MPNPTHSGVIFQNKEGEYLFQMRDGDATWAPLSWAIFGGTIEPNEKPEETAIREIREELRLEINPERLKVLGHFPDENDAYIYIYLYKETIDWNDIIVSEGSGAAFFSLQELEKIKLPKTIKYVVDTYLKK